MEHDLKLLPHAPPVLPRRLYGHQVEVPGRKGDVAELPLVPPVDGEEPKEREKTRRGFLVLQGKGRKALQSVSYKRQERVEVGREEHERIGQIEPIGGLLRGVAGKVGVEQASFLQVLNLKDVGDAGAIGRLCRVVLEKEEGKYHRRDPDYEHDSREHGEP